MVAPCSKVPQKPLLYIAVSPAFTAVFLAVYFVLIAKSAWLSKKILHPYAQNHVFKTCSETFWAMPSVFLLTNYCKKAYQRCKTLAFVERIRNLVSCIPPGGVDTFVSFVFSKNT